MDEADSIIQLCQLTSTPPALPNASLLIPPKPVSIRCDVNWPTAESLNGVNLPSVSQQPATQTNGVLLKNDKSSPIAADAEASWVGEAELEFNEDNVDGAGWDIDADLDLEIPEESSAVPVNGVTSGPPSRGPPMGSIWVRNSTLAADHIAAGSFETAMQLLNRQIGVVNFTPLKPFFLSGFQGSYTYMPGINGAPSLMAPINRKQDQVLPATVFNLANLKTQLGLAFPLMTAGKFLEAKQVFQTTLLKAVLTVVEKKDADEVLKRALIFRSGKL